ncbi:MAG: AAA domain-containing protein, partial [Hymenobacteraceae bacterium]|nr:AAA domain-containing protein [Hymenobacteraceae bacterium]
TGFAWKERRSMKGYSWKQRKELEQVVRGLPEQYAKLREELSRLSGHAVSLEELPKFTEALDRLADVQELLRQEGVAEAARQLLQQQLPLKALKERVQQLKELYLVCPAPDAAIPTEHITVVKAAIKAYRQQEAQWLKRLSWPFSPEKKTLKEALAKYKLELDEAGVGELQRRLELRQQAQELMKSINTDLQLNLRIEDNPTPVLQKLTVAGQAFGVLSVLRKLHRAKVLHEKQLPKEDLPELLQALAQRITQLQAKHEAWLQWLTEIQVKQLLEDQEYQKELLRTLPRYFEELVAHDTLYDTFSGVEKEVLQLLLKEDIPSAAEGERLFLNSLYLAWLHTLEEQHPELRTASNKELDQLETELQELLEQKQALSQEIVLSRLREQTYKHIEFNRLGNAVTYRRLQAQVSKKRSLYPIRKLFSLFSKEILDLVPCWLASPETVSAVLPLERCFDLVIFDEASQCFAETGIPAILRGRQVVVAGDEQQLRPSDLYRARWNGNGDEEVEELTAESLLGLCGLYLPQTMLTQHYRSRYPELIEFSNRYFYRHKLELIPDLADANARQPAIRFVKVHGLWQNNANVPEAEKVVELVLQLLQAGQEDIGVITFNYNQQMLVQDLLEDRAQEQGVGIPATVLVKNIENIQGDEKEVIILSVGYAPDEKGRLAMQFGSLNQAGGENRLNVAITRARQQVVVVSSLRAEQLQVEHTLHLGPKLLREYLLYAQQVSRRYFEYVPVQASVPVQVPLLKHRLEQALPQLHQEVPFADLTQAQDGRYTGVVLTDDDLYYSQQSVRHAHADVPRLLRQRHWPFQRVYSRQFWQDKEIVLERLRSIASGS